MYVSIQTVCGCHGYLLFESIHCDRCRSLIPFQLSDESLIGPSLTHNIANGANPHALVTDKQMAAVSVSYEKQYKKVTTGRVRFRTSCPFCNSSIYVLRYYCKRERIYHHVRINNYGDNDQNTYKSIAETQNMPSNNRPAGKASQTTTTTNSANESIEDSYSLSGSISQQPPSTILYDQSGLPTARDLQIENERNLYALNNLEGDLFNILRNGLFYDTLIQCQDNVKIQAHRCILGGRSNWFRNLLGEYHDANGNDDYVLQISIDDVHSEILNEVLNFIYTNRCVISLKNAPDLLVAAKRFEIERLRKQIAEFLLSRLTLDNAIEMLICAHEAGSETLKTACIRLINRHAEKIKRTEKWKTFKTEYVDLVPELYENRVERAAHQRPVYLPDVFAITAEEQSDSLRALSQMYQNPVKQRLVTPNPRILPVPPKPPNAPTSTVQQVPHQEVKRETRAGPYPAPPAPPPPQPTYQRANVSRSPPVKDQRAPLKKKGTPNPRRQTNPAPAAPPLVRTVFPTVRDSSDVDLLRRPVNVYEKSTTLPNNNQSSRPLYTLETPRESPTPTASYRAPAKSPSPPPPPNLYRAPEKTVRGVSPYRLIEIHRSPTLSSLPPDERMTLARVISVETME